jgi:hypothetical protein
VGKRGLFSKEREAVKASWLIRIGGRPIGSRNPNYFDASQRTFGREYDGAVSGLKKWLPLEANWRFS